MRILKRHSTRFAVARPAILLCLASLQLSSCGKNDTTPTPLNTMAIHNNPPPTTGEIVADATKAATYRLVPPQ